MKPAALAFITLIIGCAFLVFSVRALGTQLGGDLAGGLENLLNFDRDPFAADAIVDPPFESLTYGVQAFLWWNPHATLHMDWVQLMSFTHVKQTFAWEDIEPEQDDWHFGPGDVLLQELEARDLQLIVRLSDAPEWAHQTELAAGAEPFVDAPPVNMDDWADFCFTVADRYRGRVRAYQVWNEPNLTREWGNRPPDAAGYVELLGVCSAAIRQADPDAILISAGLAPTGNEDIRALRDDYYLQQMYDHNFQEHIDVIGVHAPGFTVPEYGPDDAQRDGFGRWATFRRIEDLRKIMIHNGDAARQMAILETGYTTDPLHPEYTWFAVTEAEQAAYMVRAYQYAADNWRPWVGLMSAIYIPKVSWTSDDEEYWWAITDPEMVEIRPAFAALAQMPKFCGDIVIPPRTPEESAVALEYNPCR